jgi:hypothetical protein
MLRFGLWGVLLTARYYLLSNGTSLTFYMHPFRGVVGAIRNKMVIASYSISNSLGY